MRSFGRQVGVLALGLMIYGISVWYWQTGETSSTNIESVSVPTSEIGSYTEIKIKKCTYRPAQSSCTITTYPLATEASTITLEGGRSP